MSWWMWVCFGRTGLRGEKRSKGKVSDQTLHVFMVFNCCLLRGEARSQASTSPACRQYSSTDYRCPKQDNHTSKFITLKVYLSIQRR